MRSQLRRIGRLGAALAVSVFWASPAAANQGLDMLTGGGAPAVTTPGLESPYKDSFGALLQGWSGFLDVWHLLDTLVVLTIAAGLGAIIAYHPRTRNKASTIEELEQPKTFIMYALVGAIVSLIVQWNSQMSLVVFGIGGLMRFRTDVGPAKDTGRVILTALVGLCVGLKMFPGAVIATAFGWVLLFYLERETYSRITIQGLDKAVLGPAAEAYRRVLAQVGCKVLGERKNFMKGQIFLIFTAPFSFDKEQFERTFTQAIPEQLRGSVDWDVS